MSNSNQPADEVEVPHPAGAGGLPPLGLHGPPELTDLGRGEAAGGAHLLLDVKGHLQFGYWLHKPPTTSPRARSVSFILARLISIVCTHMRNISVEPHCLCC